MTPAERTNSLLARIAREHGVSIAEMKGRGRWGPMVRARTQAYRELYSLGWSAASIGRLLCRNHTTVLYGLGLLRKATARPRRGDPYRLWQKGGLPVIHRPLVEIPDSAANGVSRSQGETA